ncbi:MAG: ribosomal protein S18-alanine N-acetyltransferase [Deltaproteobacteria bacterium]|nr:ribosomal protein S18-alanine N-acetyltransferase [Deltaproteobacteria bacterium]
MISPILIVPATIDNLDDIADIEQRCFSAPWDRSALAHELSALSWSRTFLAVANRTTAGFVCFWTVADEYQVLKVAVHPQFQKQGIGRLLIEHLKMTAEEEDISVISLELRHRNSAARNLYQSCGFSVVGTRRGYYTDTGDDAVLMNCLLLS